MDQISFIDRLKLKFNPHYLYQGRLLQNVADLSVSLLHLASPKDHAWKFMDYLLVKKASTFRYRGTVQSLKMIGDLDPKKHILEAVKVQSERTLNFGDIVMIDKKELGFFVDAPTV